MIRQIEASEERAEAIEQRMAKALTSSIPLTGAMPGGGKPIPGGRNALREEKEGAMSATLRRSERALLEEEEEEEEGPILEEQD
jgi:hypothetical protein